MADLLDFSGIREKEFTEVPIRAILAVLISLGLVVGFFFGKVTSEDYIDIATIVLVFYFAKRNESDQKIEEPLLNPEIGDNKRAAISVPLSKNTTVVIPAKVAPTGTAQAMVNEETAEEVALPRE